MNRYDFAAIGRLPADADNVAIATRRLQAGSTIAFGAERFTTDYTILEGHRFAVAPVAPGAALLSWGLPFGYATRAIAPGEYLRNAKILEALRVRSIDFALPPDVNFRDHPLTPYVLDAAGFRPGRQVEQYVAPRTFDGLRRTGGRGVGTRNYVVLLALTSRATGLAQAIESRFRNVGDRFPNLDGVVAVTHTEGAVSRPNNLELLLRTLAGFLVHPNVGAVVALDAGGGAVTADALRRYAREHDFPLDAVCHRFLAVENGFDATVAAGAAQVERWLPEVAAQTRTAEPLADLRLGMQCGGSDAFSGVSGNPLSAWAARELIRHGGAANLAETDELIGAEHYVLQNVRDLETANRFLATIERFKELVGRHGHTAEGNPSGGNNFRGLYNIALKSLGAATKKPPDVRLDYVIDYAEPMRAPGYYFMDSPGNDLESIAGQIGSGCNLLYFVTGNGSITNFPFVPTIKIVTTTARYRLLQRDMDVNAGAYLDGAPMDDLGRRLFEQTLAVASGERTAGERAGHAQVSIWRNWLQSAPPRDTPVQRDPALSGEPLPVRAVPADSALTFVAFRAQAGPLFAPDSSAAASSFVADQVGLILPTSLCSSQIARRIADSLNQSDVAAGRVTRFVALPHTEGCGVSGGASEELYTRTLLGYLLHPSVRRALLLEHGCEKTHNDFLRDALRRRGIPTERFGWASIQLDGGIGPVTDRVADWFRAELAALPPLAPAPAGLASLRLGLSSVGALSPELIQTLADLTRAIASAGGTVVVPESASFLTAAGHWAAQVVGRVTLTPTLAYGQHLTRSGLHLMATPTEHWVETLTGLGAAGVELVLAVTADHPVQAHHLVPVAQAAELGSAAARFPADLDLVLGDDLTTWPARVLDLILRVAGRECRPRATQQRNADFQITRGLLGVSM
ncbi:MAG: UxaA family hydrolase [Chloroflexi bacterium]|nr:UxaA family hydrolase [Chloroflexota bacterium]